MQCRYAKVPFYYLMKQFSINCGEISGNCFTRNGEMGRGITRHSELVSGFYMYHSMSLAADIP